MLKRDEVSNPTSCLNRAKEDEYVFVLLGRDESAPYAIRAWAAHRVQLGKNNYSDEQIKKALADADRIEAQQRSNK